MRLLLDTNALFWWLATPVRLPERVAACIADPDNDVLVSAASFYELEYKARRGRLPAAIDRLAEAVVASGFTPLAISTAHALRAGQLAWDHGDPWDRVIAAQAQLKECSVVTADRAFRHAPVEVLW